MFLNYNLLSWWRPPWFCVWISLIAEFLGSQYSQEHTCFGVFAGIQSDTNTGVFLWVLRSFNPKTACGGSIWPHCSFSSIREDKALVFCDLQFYHKSHFSWKFHWNFSSRLKDMKIFSVNMNYFHQFFGFFDISLLQKN